jgi:transcription antitermination factor NusG
MPADHSPAPAFPQKGDVVRIRRGTFAGLEGRVLAVDERRRAARVLFTLHGSPTLSDIAYADIEPRSA